MGGRPREGVGGRKVRALPRKFVFLGFRREESGMSREFFRDVPDPGGVQKVCAKKKFVRILHSLIKHDLWGCTPSETEVHMGPLESVLVHFPLFWLRAANVDRRMRTSR